MNNFINNSNLPDNNLFIKNLEIYADKRNRFIKINPKGEIEKIGILEYLKHHFIGFIGKFNPTKKEIVEYQLIRIIQASYLVKSPISEDENVINSVKNRIFEEIKGSHKELNELISKPNSNKDKNLVENYASKFLDEHPEIKKWKNIESHSNATFLVSKNLSSSISQLPGLSSNTDKNEAGQPHTIKVNPDEETSKEETSKNKKFPLSTDQDSSFKTKNLNLEGNSLSSTEGDPLSLTANLINSGTTIFPAIKTDETIPNEVNQTSFSLEELNQKKQPINSKQLLPTKIIIHKTDPKGHSSLKKAGLLGLALLGGKYLFYDQPSPLFSSGESSQPKDFIPYISSFPYVSTFPYDSTFYENPFVPTDYSFDSWGYENLPEINYIPFGSCSDEDHEYLPLHELYFVSKEEFFKEIEVFLAMRVSGLKNVEPNELTSLYNHAIDFLKKKDAPGEIISQLMRIFFNLEHSHSLSNESIKITCKMIEEILGTLSPGEGNYDRLASQYQRFTVKKYNSIELALKEMINHKNIEIKQESLTLFETTYILDKRTITYLKNEDISFFWNFLKDASKDQSGTDRIHGSVLSYIKFFLNNIKVDRLEDNQDFLDVFKNLATHGIEKIRSEVLFLAITILDNIKKVTPKSPLFEMYAYIAQMQVDESLKEGGFSNEKIYQNTFTIYKKLYEADNSFTIPNTVTDPMVFF